MPDEKKVDPSYAGFGGSANEPVKSDNKPHADPKGADVPKHPHPMDEKRDEEHSRKRK